jgi:succinyl-diaminopimelate desuccinylase
MLTEILARLIAFYPVTSNQENVKRLLDFVQQELVTTGSFGDTTIIENNGVQMLYGSTQRTKHPRLLLQAHVDVVPAPKDLRRAVIKDGKLYGRGARDMLFAAAAYMKLCAELGPQLSDLDIGIMLTGDEEVGGINSVPFLLQQGYSADLVWLSDAGNTLTDLVTNAKGVLNFDIITNGQAHHGSRPWEGDNAAAKLVALLHNLQTEFESPTNTTTTCSITQLEAGDSVNKGPALARAHIDIRYTDHDERKRCMQLAQRLCADYDGEIKNMTTGDHYSVDISHPLIAKYIELSKTKFKRRVTPIAVSGSSDARYFSAAGIPVIMTRPLSHGSHSDSEWVDLESLEEYYQILKAYLLKVATIGEV